MFKDNMSKSEWIKWGLVNKLQRNCSCDQACAFVSVQGQTQDRYLKRHGTFSTPFMVAVHLWQFTQTSVIKKQSRRCPRRRSRWRHAPFNLALQQKAKSCLLFCTSFYFPKVSEAKDLMRTNESAFRLLTKGINMSENKYVPIKQICPMLLNDDYHCCIVLWFLEWALNLCAATTPLYAIHILFSLLTKMTTYCMSMTPVAGIDESQWSLL